ncbi:MAG: hypothetical protein HY400_01090, partial [Elusimicrobia bacterium]|nr:hypothetical protein [Elusimicrobiota bacterium]
MYSSLELLNIFDESELRDSSRIRRLFDHKYRSLRVTGTILLLSGSVFTVIFLLVWLWT